jgi:acyl-CoA synthetase (AMP-forming)/AMP-acid ligase II
VGRKFESIEWRVIRITDEPIRTIDETEELPPGNIGELIVRGPQVSPFYVTRAEANLLSKIAHSSTEYSVPMSRHNNTTRDSSQNAPPAPWHRTGDVGYLDTQGRFWYCGRKSQRVDTAAETLFTECVEAVFNEHPDVTRTALVGLGQKGDQLPVIVYQLHTEFARTQRDMALELSALGKRFAHSRSVKSFAEIDRLPVDIRHNAKILREKVAEWVKKELVLTEAGEPSTPA